MWKAAAALLATRQGTGTGSGRARLLWFLGMAGGAGLLAFAAAELLVRSFPAYLPAEILRALHEQAMAANDPASLPHDHLGYVWRPHHKDEFTTGDFRFSYATDEHGFRNPTPWPDQASVVVLGDSQAFAFGVDDERSWVRLLGQRLPGRHVVNLGIIGAAPQQFRRVYETYGARLRPEVVLVAFSPSNVLHSARLFDEWLAAGKPDRFDARRSRDLFADGEAGGLTGTLRSYLGRSHAIRLLHHVLTGGGGASVTVEGDDGRVHLFPGRRERAAATAAAGSEDFERVIEILRELHDEVRATGGEMLAVPFPSKEEVHLPLLGRQPASLVAPFIAAFERLDIPHVDLTPLLQERIADGERLFFEVDMHPNVAGYRLIAAALADHLRRYVAPAPDPDAGPHRMPLPDRAAAPPDPLRTEWVGDPV